MAEAHLIEPTFTAVPTKDGTICIRMDEGADEPVLHIGSFGSEREAQAWIRDEAAAWSLKRQPRQKALKGRGKAANA
jgi:hypothetical protein